MRKGVSLLLHEDVPILLFMGTLWLDRPENPTSITKNNIVQRIFFLMSEYALFSFPNSPPRFLQTSTSLLTLSATPSIHSLMLSADNLMLLDDAIRLFFFKRGMH